MKVNILYKRIYDRNIRDILECPNRIKSNYSNGYNCYSIIILLWNERNRFIEFAEDMRGHPADDKQSQWRLDDETIYCIQFRGALEPGSNLFLPESVGSWVKVAR